MLIVSMFIGCTLNVLLYFYIFNAIVHRRKMYLKKKEFGFIFVSVILYVLLQNYDFMLKPVLTHLVLFLSLKMCYRENWVATLLSIILTSILTVVSEVVIVSSILSFNLETLIDNRNIIGMIFSNVSVMLLAYSLFKIKYMQKLFKKIICFSKNYSYTMTLVIGGLILSSGIYISYKNLYVEQSLLYLMFFNLFFLATYVFAMSFFNEKSNNSKLSEEYNYLMDYIKEYEKVLNDKSKVNHEYKNQLVIIKNMVEENEDGVTDYIDKNLDMFSAVKDTNYLRKLKNIPKGGLKGLIYYKIEKMREKDIGVLVEVSEAVSNEKVWVECNKNLYDISRVVGVFLDNALDATSDAEKRNIIISVDYMDSELIFEISNTFNDVVDLEKIYELGFSTKGKGRGQGLALVEELVRNNQNIRKETVINGELFVQKLYIK